jgi:hypothetical protein
MAKGKSFEQLVHIIQETLKDHPATKVFQNKHLKSRTGRLRQFDVVIETSINSYEIRLVIECKDHLRKVESSAIEAFATKCDLVGGIHRRIFISNAGFQKGAVVSAKELGIELHVLEKISGERIIGWINTEEMYSCRFSRKINHVDLKLVGNIEDIPDKLEDNDIVYYTDGQSSTYINFLEWLLKDPNAQQIIKNRMMFQIPDFQAKGTLYEEHEITITKHMPKYAFLKVRGKDIFIQEVTFKLGIYIHDEKIQPDVRIMRHPEGDEIQAGVLTFPYSQDGSTLQMVIEPAGKFKHFVINPDGSIKHELKTIAKYDPKTQKYELPDPED